MNNITIALAGNPNSGKTSIFNMLTGARQQVANYPGVTVEKKQGRCKYAGCAISIVDLPGTYSLTAYSSEELVARNFIIHENIDVVVDIVDASNIERNLYLTTQLMELNVPLVLALNMSDVAEQKGLHFDIDQFARLLRAAVVPTIGNKGKGKTQLLDAIIQTAKRPKAGTGLRINYGPEIEHHLMQIERILSDAEPQLTKEYDSRWLAVKLLENDSDIIGKVRNKAVTEAVLASREHLRKIFRDEPEIVMADRRYGFISGACQETVKTTVESRHDRSDMIDAVVINRILGMPIFLGLMYVVFQATFAVGAYPMGWLEHLFGWAARTITSAWPHESLLWLQSLLVEGVIGGVGGVVVFLPNILLLFLAIAILEDSGYMARAAFIMDRIMHKIGLHGKSFIPMLIGFGCSVPAIMATRILENRRNRLTTIMVIPLMSCGAKLTIYALFIPAFFTESWRPLILWVIYLIGIGIAVIVARLLRVTLFRGETIPFVMELPPYRMPTLKAVLIHTWQRGWMYLRKAGTIILAISIILWAAANYPKPDADLLKGMTAEQAHQQELIHSTIGRIGKAIEPVMKPLGFDWKIGTALIGAAAAKEVFVSQLGIVYAAGSADERSQSLREKLQENYSALTAFCVMLFCLIGTPCVATLAITRQETGRWRWVVLQFVGLTVLAYIVTFVVYSIGTLI